jgi:photosystem II stability/assembly factor-like uncharacterized protein
VKRLLIILSIFIINRLGLAETSAIFAVAHSSTSYKIDHYPKPAAGLFVYKRDNWQHLGWPYGKFFSITIPQTSDTSLLYLACGNGLFKSNNHGKAWKITTGWEITECLHSAVHPTDHDKIYLACAYGIFYSADGGEHWQERNNGLLSTFISKIIFDRDNPDHLFCATECGLYKSMDQGQTWQPMALLNLGVRTLIQHPLHGEILAAATENNGVFISADRGRTWQAKANGLDHLTVYALAFSPQDSKTLYAGTYKGGVYKTIDLGTSWQAINSGLDNLEIHALAVDSKNPTIIYAGTLGSGIYKSINAGRSWHFFGLETCEIWDIVLY